MVCLMTEGKSCIMQYGRYYLLAYNQFFSCKDTNVFSHRGKNVGKKWAGGGEKKALIKKRPPRCLQI